MDQSNYQRTSLALIQIWAILLPGPSEIQGRCKQGHRMGTNIPNLLPRPPWSAHLSPCHTESLEIKSGNFCVLKFAEVKELIRDQRLCKQPNQIYLMFIARGPLFTLGLCLGGFILIPPSSTATFKYNYSDGSICDRCVVDSSSDCFPGGIDTACVMPAKDCTGSYYPPDFSIPTLGSKSRRKSWSYNKCLFDAYNYDNNFELTSSEICCFTPGSPVCISNFLVHYKVG